MKYYKFKLSPFTLQFEPILNGVKYFPNSIFPWGNMGFHKWQLPKCAISQAATSQMYIFPNNNFPSGNFPMKEKRYFPHEGSIKVTFKFYIF